MKILVLTSTYSRWENDTEPKFVDNLCRYLSKSNEVHVVAPHAPGIPRQENMDGIPVFRFKYCFEHWQHLAYDGGILPSIKENRLRVLLIPLFIFSELLLTIKLLREHHYDVIHAHWIVPQGLVAVFARTFTRKRAAIVITSHGGDLFALKGKVLTRLKRWITAQAAHLTVVSSTMKTNAARLNLKNEHDISVIPMGMDSKTMFCPPASPDKRKGLVFVGRLVEKKGLEYLLGAMPAVLQAHPNERLTIVGDGPLKDDLSRLIKSLGISEAVKFTGSATNSEIPFYLQAATIAIFPSVVAAGGDQEGTPVAIMEALACACPVIVGDYPGARDIIEHGGNGLLVEQKSADDIAQAINFLLSNADERTRLGNTGRTSVVNDYDWDVISARFEQLFLSITTTTGQPHT